MDHIYVIYKIQFYINNQYIFLINYFIYLFIFLKIIAYASNLYLSLIIEYISENSKVKANALFKISITNNS